MKMIRKMVLLCSTVMLALSIQPGYAYRDTAHRGINEKALWSSHLDKTLKDQVGIPGGIEAKLENIRIEKLIQDAGVLEDAELRFNQHFHNPLKPWDNAGLGTFWSSIIWSQLLDDDGSGANRFSWSSARRYYYQALSTGSESDWALTFRSLGQVMHLVSDAAVPAHVRNDVHVWPDIYEVWLESKWKDLSNGYLAAAVDQSIFNRAVSNPYAPIPISALLDQDVYNGTNPSNGLFGLAEYTNANFFSEDTVLFKVSSSDYPHPSFQDTNWAGIDWKHPELIYELNKPYLRVYIYRSGEAQEPQARIALSGYLMYDCLTKGYFQTSPWVLDDKVHEAYAAKLIPRAIGYSASLLDYFFRGVIEVKDFEPLRDSGCNIVGVDLKMRNASKLGAEAQAMESGRIDLAYRFTPPGQSKPVAGLLESAYIIASSSDIINSDYVATSLVLPGSIPPGAKNIALTLIFRGQLGKESDAVAGKTLAGSKIAYSVQPNGPGTPSYICTMNEDGTETVIVTSIADNFPMDEMPIWSRDRKMLAYAGRDAENRYSIVVLNMASNTPSIMTVLDAKASELYPAFSPDGTRIYALMWSAMNGVISFDRATGAWEYMVSEEFWQDKTTTEEMKLSPSGDKIVYVLWMPDGNGNNARNIVSVRTDGTSITFLTSDTEYINKNPAWSPDGQLIAFVSNRDGSQQTNLWLMDELGASKRKVLDCDGGCYSPVFSPDGRKILYVAGDNELYTVNTDGSGITKLTSDGLAKATPSWSTSVYSEACYTQ